MKLIKPDTIMKKFHELQITVDDSEGYAEIIEVFRESKDGPGFIVITSVRAIAPIKNSSEKKVANRM